MVKVELEATEMPVAVALSALPGDVLLVVNGVCVGVRHSKAAGAPRLKNRKPQFTNRAPGEAKAQTIEFQERLLGIYRSRGPMTNAEMYDALRIPHKNTTERARVNWHIRNMADKGMTRRHPEDVHKHRPPYGVAPARAKKAAAKKAACKKHAAGTKGRDYKAEYQKRTAAKQEAA